MINLLIRFEIYQTEKEFKKLSNKNKKRVDTKFHSQLNECFIRLQKLYKRLEGDS